MAVVLTLAAGWLASVLVAGALPTPTLAASPTRIKLFDPRGNRTGSAVVEGDRVDLFDARGNRTGTGRIEDKRRVDFFDTKGSRTGFSIIGDTLIGGPCRCPAERSKPSRGAMK